MSVQKLHFHHQSYWSINNIKKDQTTKMKSIMGTKLFWLVSTSPIPFHKQTTRNKEKGEADKKK
jgi:hypothetical protein